MSGINGRFEELVVSESDGNLYVELQGTPAEGSPSIDLFFNADHQVQDSYPLIQSLREIGGYGNVNIYTPCHPPVFEVIGWPNTSDQWPRVYVKKPSRSGANAIRCYAGINGDLGVSRQEIESLYKELTKLYNANKSE